MGRVCFVANVDCDSMFKAAPVSLLTVVVLLLVHIPLRDPDVLVKPTLDGGSTRSLELMTTQRYLSLK